MVAKTFGLESHHIHSVDVSRSDSLLEIIPERDGREILTLILFCLPFIYLCNYHPNLVVIIQNCAHIRIAFN